MTTARTRSGPRRDADPPRRGPRPSRARVLLTVVLPALILTAAVLLLLPSQQAPAVTPLADGSVRYVIIPLRMAAALPVLVTSFVLVGSVVAGRTAPARSGRVGKVVVRLFVLGALALSWWIPSHLFRAVVVDGSSVTIEGVPLRTTVPRDRIARVEVGHQESTNRRGRTCIVQSVEIHEASGEVHRSAYWCYEPGSHGFRRLEGVLRALERDLGGPPQGARGGALP